MSAGKGDKPRPVNGEKYRANYDYIFGRNPQTSTDDDHYTIEDKCRDKCAADAISGHHWSNW